MIVDALTHVTPDGHWFDTTIDASEGRLLRELDLAGVDRAVVVALAGYISNAFVLEICRRYGDRLIPGASFNPAAFETAEDAVRSLRADLRGRPYPVLKLHPRLNGYDPLDPRCLAALEEITTWADPPKIWIDTLLHGPTCRLRRGVVATIHELVTRFDALTFVLLHAGGAWLLQVAEAIRECANAYLDCSFVLLRYEQSSLWQDLRFLLTTFDRRMVFGSDFPEITPADALAAFRRLADGVPEEKARNVLGANLEAILPKDNP